jgi:acyl-coenzyme A thioesterase PaaI-like protein
MKFAFNLIDKLLKSESTTSLMALNKVLTIGIPFNAPHGFKIKEISNDQVLIKLPNRKLNHNHLGGIHACAMATVGEYCAGMSLLKTFGASKYRLILADLHVKYTYQGRTDLEGSCSLHQIQKDLIEESLSKEGKFLQELKTIIREKAGKEVAVVTTTWQLKSWDQVKTKN